MNPDPSRPTLGHDRTHSGARARKLFARVLTITAGVAVLIGAVAVSIVVFAIALTGLLIFGLYFWWRTRHVRRQLQAMRARPANDDVIEGEVIRHPRKDDHRDG